MSRCVLPCLTTLTLLLASSGCVSAPITDARRQSQPSTAPVEEFSRYLRAFDYSEREAMKIKTGELLDLVRLGKAQVIDIRFPDEVATWRVSFAKSIPLNELPDRLDELDREKLIVPVCPHADRASIARHYLTLKGYRSRYLVDGLLGLAEHLRGDKARDFVESAADGKTNTEEQNR